MMNNPKILNPSEIQLEFDRVERQFPLFETRPIYTEGGEEIKNRVGVFTDKQGEQSQPLAVVSKRYKLINFVPDATGQGLFNTLRSVISDGGYPIQELQLHTNQTKTQMFMDLCLAKFEKVRVGDMVRYDVRVGNSVDSTWTLFALPRSFRLICLNGAMHVIQGEQTSFKHVGLTLGDIKKAIDTVLNFHSKIADLYHTWSDTKIPKLEFNSTKLKNNQDQLTLNMHLDEETNTWIADHIPHKYLTDLRKNNPQTKFDLFNSLTESNTHDKGRSIFTQQKFDTIIQKFVEIISAIA